MKDLTAIHLHSKLSVYADTVAKLTAEVRNQVGPKIGEVNNLLNPLFIHQWQRLRELQDTLP